MSRLKELQQYLERIGNPDPIQEAFLIETLDSEGLHDASGNLPELKLDGKSWDNYARQIAQKKGAVTILDLGSGSDCAAYTGGNDGTRLNPAIKRLRQEGVPLRIIAQSKTGYSPQWLNEHGIDVFIEGHFIDALQQVQRNTVDIVLSRYALYQTRLSTHILGLIDDVLSPEGAAFLETVSRGAGHNKILIFRENDLPNPILTSEDVQRSIPLDRARVGGLLWQRDADSHLGTTYRKGQINKRTLPIPIGIFTTDFRYPDCLVTKIP